jgi:hypothetical protein
MSPERWINTLNNPVCAVDEQENLLEGIAVEEPLKSWLESKRL